MDKDSENLVKKGKIWINGANCLKGSFIPPAGGGGWRRMAADGGGWRRMAADGGGWRRVAAGGGILPTYRNGKADYGEDIDRK